MQQSDMPDESDDWKKSPGKKKKTYRLEYRLRPELRGKIYARWGRDWSPYFSKYRTEKEREKALNVLNRKDTLFEYRLPEVSA